MGVGGLGGAPMRGKPPLTQVWYCDIGYVRVANSAAGVHKTSARGRQSARELRLLPSPFPSWLESNVQSSMYVGGL